MHRTILVLFLVIASSLAQNLNLSLLVFTQSGNAGSLFSGKPRPGFATLDNNVYVAYNNLSQVNLPGGDVSWVAEGVETPNGGSCAVFADNGDLYILGGDTGNGLGSTQALILAAGANVLDGIAPMSTPRQHHRCVYDKFTRRIYVVGSVLGNGTFLTSAEYYSLDNGNWVPIADYPYQRADFGLVSTNDGFLYAFGGRFSGSATPTAELLRYNISTDTWTLDPQSLSLPVSGFGYWYDDQTKLIGLFGGVDGACQVVDMSNSSAPKPIALDCTPDLTSGYSLSAVVGPNIYVISSNSGNVYESKCALFTKCPYGCNATDGTCIVVYLPITAPPIAHAPSVPFSGCGQCSGDTPLCIADRSTCVGNRVVPILQCIDALDSGTKVAYYSYNRVGASTPQVLTITAGSTNNLVTPSGNPNSDFTPGRSIFYPLASFTAQYSPNTNVEWFLDGYALDFSSSNTALACPKNITIAVRVLNITGNVQEFIDQLRQVLADTMGIDIDQIAAVFSTQKRDSGLEQEISVVVSPSSEPAAPSPAETITNFIKNETAIQQVQSQIPEVQEVKGKPLPTELSGQIVPSTSPSPTQNTVPKAVSSANLSREILSVVSLGLTLCTSILTFV